MARLSDTRGFTMIEVMVATAILLTAVLGTLALMETANTRTRTSADRQRATSLVRDVIEAVRALPYRQVDDDSIAERLQAADGLEGNGDPDAWEIERGGTTVALDVQVCSLDDPADGRGSHSAGDFCADAGAQDVVDGSPADYKRVTVTGAWSNESGAGSVRQASLVTARGGGDAPAISSLVMTAPATLPITSTSVTRATFAAETSVDPESVVWTLDGVQQGVASGIEQSWTFGWTLPGIDGTYLVAAQAFDSSGVSGAEKSLTIKLNRYSPFAPDDWAAGRNGSVVETEWSANRERDIVRYHVYRRTASGGSTLVCDVEKTEPMSCIDAKPPSAGGTLEYWVVAVDLNSSDAEREGASSARIDVNLANQAPNAPSGLTLGRDESGRAVLSWSVPSPGDPDPGDAIDSYRIYRDGTAVADRYDRTGSGADSRWVDPDTSGGEHRYWVSAIDSHLRESTLAGPVGG